MITSRPDLRNSRKTRLRMDHQGEPGPIIVQIAGGIPAMMADAADIFEGWMITPEDAAETRASLAPGDVEPDLWGAETAGFFRAHCDRAGQPPRSP